MAALPKVHGLAPGNPVELTDGVLTIDGWGPHFEKSD